MTKHKLTSKDVTELLADPSAAARAGTAARLASEFQRGSLTASERSMVEDIFRIMVKDAELRVRNALAQNLKENHGCPMTWPWPWPGTWSPCPFPSSGFPRCCPTKT